MPTLEIEIPLGNMPGLKPAVLRCRFSALTLSVRECAEQFGVSASEVRADCESGKLEGTSGSGKFRIPLPSAIRHYWRISQSEAIAAMFGNP